MFNDDQAALRDMQEEQRAGGEGLSPVGGTRGGEAQILSNVINK